MIDIIGFPGSSEYQAAETLANAISKMWPGVKRSPREQEHICIAANVKISGYQVSDIDVVLAISLLTPRSFLPKTIVKDTNNRPVGRSKIHIRNLLVAIEVKDHDQAGVKINGDNVYVMYKGGWSDATDQNIKQLHSLGNYAKDRGTEAFIHRCLIMQGLDTLKLSAAVAGSFRGEDFFSSIAAQSRVLKSSSGYELSSGVNNDIRAFLNAPIFKTITPSRLDRRRMDLITTQTKESAELLNHIGKSMVRLRGHGGTGKTIMLLQTAWAAYEERGLRSLVLTYNHALAADIRRSLALLQAPTQFDDKGIEVMTTMSFMYSWLSQFGLAEEGVSFEKYESKCVEAANLISQEAITKVDVQKIVESNREIFDFDCIVVDEAQDWPQSEIDLLKLLYSPTKIAIADGIDQLIRGHRSNWESNVSIHEKHIIPLKNCLRMKRNLSVFVKDVAEASNIRWNMKPNTHANGGRVFVILKDYLSCENLHEDLLNDACKSGNRELDFLFCVPSSDVISKNNTRQSELGDRLKARGYKVWNGVDDIRRRDFPRTLEEFRIVQYHSCRGLEGWTVVLNKLDSFWEHSKENKLKTGLTSEEEIRYLELNETACIQAWQRTLIALTRPIDTLVITLDDLSSKASLILLEVASKHPDFATVIH